MSALKTLLDPTTDRDEILRRTVLLAEGMVGCGQVCSCRAGLAAITTVEQLPLVEAQARAVKSEGASGGWEALKTSFGDSVTKNQEMCFEAIEMTPQDPEYARTKDGGGIAAAEQSFKAFFEPDPLEQFFQDLLSTLGGAAVVRAK